MRISACHCNLLRPTSHACRHEFPASSLEAEGYLSGAPSDARMNGSETLESHRRKEVNLKCTLFPIPRSYSPAEPTRALSGPSNMRGACRVP